MEDRPHRTRSLIRGIPGVLVVMLVIAGAALCHPPFPLAGVLGFVAYAPLFVVLVHCRSRFLAAALGLGVGMTQVLLQGNWIVFSLAHPATALVALAIFNGILWSAAALAIALLRVRGGWARPLIVAVIPLMEWVRAENPWLPIAYGSTQHMIADNVWFAQGVEAFGSVGLAIVVAGFSLAAADIWEAKGPERRCRLGGWLAVLAVMHGAGLLRILTWPEDDGRCLHVAVVQLYAPRSPEGISATDKQELLDRLQRRLSQDRFDLVVLPESSLYVPLPAAQGPEVKHSLLSPAELSEHLARWHGPPALAGMVIDVAGAPGAYRNAIGVVLPGAGLGEVRDKLLPAPVGEAIPFEGVPLLAGLGAEVAETSGTLVTLDARADLPIPNGPRLAVAICGEHMYPSVWQKRGLDSLDDVDWQVIVADMSWFGYDERERAQSRAARRLLAIQHRRPLLYVANGGSEWIDALGRVRASCDAQAEGMSWRVPVHDTSRPQAIPAMLAVFLIGGVLGMIGFSGPRVRKQASLPPPDPDTPAA